MQHKDAHYREKYFSPGLDIRRGNPDFFYFHATPRIIRDLLEFSIAPAAPDLNRAISFNYVHGNPVSFRRWYISRHLIGYVAEAHAGSAEL